MTLTDLLRDSEDPDAVRAAYEHWLTHEFSGDELADYFVDEAGDLCDLVFRKMILEHEIREAIGREPDRQRMMEAASANLTNEIGRVFYAIVKPAIHQAAADYAYDHWQDFRAEPDVDAQVKQNALDKEPLAGE